jgi:hypothetical protein
MHAALVSNFLTGLQDMLNVAHDGVPDVVLTNNPSPKPVVVDQHDPLLGFCEALSASIAISAAASSSPSA